MAKNDTVSTEVRVDKSIRQSTINLVKVQNFFPAKVIHTGLVSGQQYVWNEAGATIEVDSRDVPDLLAYQIGKQNCCGGAPSGFQVFQVVE